MSLTTEIDLKSSIDIESRLEKGQAKKLISEILTKHPGAVGYTKHCLEEMTNDKMIIGDLLNVLRAGLISDPPEFEKEQWRYRVQTKKITVVVSFAAPNKIRCVTTWRMK